MSGLKFKVAHKRAQHEKWNGTAKTQRKRMVKFLKEMISALEKEPISLNFTYKNQQYVGEALPIQETCHDGICEELDISLNDEQLGIIRRLKSGWKMDNQEDEKFIQAIGEAIVF
jgi:hypothetical protein